MIAQLDSDYIRSRPGRAFVRLVSYGLFEGRPLTTRGRWINPIVFTACRLADRYGRQDRVVQPVFIVGMGRSGTTILGKVLSFHPRVGFLNEPKAMWHYIHSGEDIIGNYTRGPARFRIGREDATASRCRTARRVFGFYLSVVGASTLVDKYPELIFRIPFVREIFPDARFVWMVRNGLDTAKSVAKWCERHGTVEGSELRDWWGVDNRKWDYLVRDLAGSVTGEGAEVSWVEDLSRDEDRAAVEWLVTAREGLEYSSAIPDDFLRVRYEDLTEAPREQMRRILDHAGLSHDTGLLEYADRVMRPAPPREEPEIHPCLREPMAKLMGQLGYET